MNLQGQRHPRDVHTATHCNALQRTATHCNALRHTATLCNTLQHTTTHCNTAQHSATHCITLHHTASLFITLRHASMSRVKFFTWNGMQCEGREENILNSRLRWFIKALRGKYHYFSECEKFQKSTVYSHSSDFWEISEIQYIRWQYFRTRAHPDW